MLDTETPDNVSSASGAAEQPAAAAPRKRAPRKAAANKAVPADAPPAGADNVPAPEESPAPRKRAPRKAAAKKATTDADTAAIAVSSDNTASAPAQPAAEPTSEPRNESSAPAKRAPRKRAQKAPATELPLDEGLVPAAESAATFAPEGATPPAAKKTTRKRAAKKAAAEPPAENATDASADPAAAAMSTAGVLFMAPQETEAPKRRRTAKKSAAKAAPEADATTDELGTTAADTDADADSDEADPDDVREAAIEQANGARRRRRRGRRGRGGGAKNDDSADDTADDATGSPTAAEASDDSADTVGEDVDDSTDADGSEESGSSRRRRRRRRSGSGGGGGEDSGNTEDDPPNTVTHVRDKKASTKSGSGKSGGGDDDGVKGIKGSTRLEAKRQRRRDGRETGRRRAPILTEAEFLARREAVDRVMAVRQRGDRTQIAVLEDDILVEHYVTRASATSYVGNVYLGRVQNVLPSMEAAFVDIGKGRNGVLYAGEVNWDAAGLDGKSRTIEHAMKSGDSVLVQVTKDPIGHKGARLTSQVSLPGRFLVYVPGGGMTGISRRLPDTERHRLKAILKKIVPDEAGVIVRTAAEGASEEDLTHDVERLQAQWDTIQSASQPSAGSKGANAPLLLHGEPDLAIRVVRDVFNEDFTRLVVEGDDAWTTVSDYVGTVAPDLAERVSRHVAESDLFHDLRVDEQLMKALDRKVWLPSGGSLVIDRTEAMTVVDVNTGRFVGSGGNLEQTVTRNNLEAAEEIVRQLRLRDVGGIVVIDFIDMVLESNRDLVLRRLTECLGRDRTKHQVAEVTSLGLVQMTRKRVGEGLLEAFSEQCEHCHGRGVIVHGEPIDLKGDGAADDDDRSGAATGRKRGRRGGRSAEPVEAEPPATVEQRQAANAAIAAIHRATAAEGEDGSDPDAPSQLNTLATDLVNAAMKAEKNGSGRSKSNGRREIEPVRAEPVVPSSSTPPATSEAEPEVTEAVSSPSEVATSGSDGVVDNDAPPAGPPARRRRRAASRPEGPPVHA